MMQPEQIPQAVLDRLDSLSAKLGTTIEHLWVVLTRQAALDAWAALASVLMIALLVIGGLVITRWAARKYVKCGGDELDRNCWGILMTIAGIGTALGTVALATRFANSLLPRMLTGWCNPEAYALTQVLRALG